MGNLLVSDWIIKAEGDYRTACREFQVSDNPTYESVCFHVQQCLEKYLKALLAQAGQPVPRTHDLLELIGLLNPFHPELAEWENADIAEVNLGAVEMRYAGAVTRYADAALFMHVCDQFLEVIKPLLPSNSS